MLGFVDGKVLLIRRARQDDLDHLLWSGEHLRANRQRFLDLQGEGEAVILVPTLDDVPIGHLAVDLLRLRDEGGVYLYRFEYARNLEAGELALRLSTVQSKWLWQKAVTSVRLLWGWTMYGHGSFMSAMGTG